MKPLNKKDQTRPLPWTPELRQRLSVARSKPLTLKEVSATRSTARSAEERADVMVHGLIAKSRAGLIKLDD